MYLYDYEKTYYHGGSLRLIAKEKNYSNKYEAKIKKGILKEEEFGLFKDKIYKTIAKNYKIKKIIQ